MVERCNKIIKLFIFVFNFLFFVSLTNISDYYDVKINNIIRVLYFALNHAVNRPKKNFKGNRPFTDFVIVLFFSYFLLNTRKLAPSMRIKMWNLHKRTYVHSRLLTLALLVHLWLWDAFCLVTHTDFWGFIFTFEGFAKFGSAL